jgi:hypothetical protein
MSGMAKGGRSRTILSIWGVGVRRGSGWQEIDGGMGDVA